MDEIQLPNYIIGRVQPAIYGFVTNTIPNYLKVGDTYRPVEERLNEWRKFFSDLDLEFEDSAMLDSNIYFRDYSVHSYLENDLNKERLTREQLPSGVHYSNEFFKATSSDDIKNAIAAIKNAYPGKYDYYKLSEIPNNETEYKREGYWTPRENQNQVVENFTKAVKNHRKNLLMYAVMRFGKSFTAMSCALTMNNGKGAKIVIIVSGKKDVQDEWRATIQKAKNFEKYDYIYGSRLKRKGTIKKILASGKNVAVFLTLQDLSGDVIKDKHKEIFKKKIDLLIVDETHFAARSEHYGEVLRNTKLSKKCFDEDDNIEEYDEKCKDAIKAFKTKVTIHLSGTPYRILMGSEFEKQDVIAFCQFSDIVKAQQEWHKKYIESGELGEDGKKEEWDNPYFGFPQMVRFAFNPNTSSSRKLELIKKSGKITYAFSELLAPVSMIQDEHGDYKKFANKDEVLDLLRAIDGSKKDANILSILDCPEIQKGEMCRHMVFVLPFRASCDAMESMLRENRFNHLNEYEIVNISGLTVSDRFANTENIKKVIKEYESSNKKTITLTVNRMLTGATVPEWDTMIYLKDTESPQEYDQAVFRLQSPYVVTYTDDKGKTIKFNKKPQTVLVDFCPERLFRMQELKSQIYNTNVEQNGNSKLQERIREELEISPVITINKDKLVKVNAVDVMDAVSEYTKNRGVAELTQEIPVDVKLYEIPEIRKAIEKENAFGDKKGFTIEAHEGESTDMDVPLGDEVTDSGDEDNASNNGSGNTGNKEKTDLEKFVEKFKTYYARILYFAFLTNSKIVSLDDLVKVSNASDNKRILSNIGLSKKVLELINKKCYASILSQLDYRIKSLNDLSHNPKKEPLERAKTANKQFGRLGESEIVTPLDVARKMVALIPDSVFDECVNDPSKKKILDYGSKEGEFAIVLVERFQTLGYELSEYKDVICSIPTSSMTKEFVRKIYDFLGLNVDNIAEFDAYDILKITKESDKVDYDRVAEIVKSRKCLKKVDLHQEGRTRKVIEYAAIVGNPPYHLGDGGAGASAKPLYNIFIEQNFAFQPNHMCMIVPARWYTGGKKLDLFRTNMLADKHIEELHDFPITDECFPNVNIRCGVCYFKWSREFDNNANLTKVVTHIGSNVFEVLRTMKHKDIDIFIRYYKALSIIDKVRAISGDNMMTNIISSRKPFGITGNIVKKATFRVSTSRRNVICYVKGQEKGYVENDEILAHKEWISKWKVFIPRSDNIGTELNDDNLNCFVGRPNEVCSETYIVGGGDCVSDEESAQNMSLYLKTKFARFLHSMAKASQDATSKTFRFVPIQDFSRTWTDIELYNMYGLTDEERDFIELMIKPME